MAGRSMLSSLPRFYRYPRGNKQYLFEPVSPARYVVRCCSFGLNRLETKDPTNPKRHRPSAQPPLAADGGQVCLISKFRRRFISDKSARYNLLVGVSGLLSVCSAVLSM